MIQIKLRSTYERNFLKKKFSWTNITLLYISLRYFLKGSQLLSKKKVFQTSAGLMELTLLTPFRVTDWSLITLLTSGQKWQKWLWFLRCLVLCPSWNRAAWKVMEIYKCQPFLSEGNWRENSCAVRHFLKRMDTRSFSIPLAFPFHQHCSLFETKNSGEFLEALPKRLGSLYFPAT